jgi:glycosyltransferase involved in cell wall biosynthesis
MRLIISALSAPSDLNGVSRHAANIVKGLLSWPDAPEIHFLGGAWQKEMYSRAIGRTHSRLRFHWLPIRHRTLDRVRWYYHELPTLARRLEADLVHLAYTMPMRKNAFNCPILVSLHDLYPFDIPQNFGFLKGAVNRQLMQQCLRKVSAIACVSSSTRNRLSHWFGPILSRKAVTIPNAVEPHADVSPSGPCGLRNEQRFLLCIAQHRRNKNIPLVVRIFERLTRNGVIPRETKLLIVGISGPETPKVKAQIYRSKLDCNVILASGMTDPELQWCYRNCRLLLAPSSIEGFGLPVAEALLAGSPLVCSDIPAFREVGAERCRYIKFGDQMLIEYENAIREALAEPRPSPISLPHLLPKAIARQYMNLYHKLLGYRGVPPESAVASHWSSETEELHPANVRTV